MNEVRILLYYNISSSFFLDNTSLLLKLLNERKIDVAVIDGNFNKSEYDYELFSIEEFIGICPVNSIYSMGEYTLEDLFDNILILRESGYGTRDVSEQLLYEQNLCINNFKSICEIGSLLVIISLISNNCGISFIYKKTTKSFIDNNLISKINIKGLPIKREFNFVWLKNSKFASMYDDFFNECRNINL